MVEEESLFPLSQGDWLLLIAYVVVTSVLVAIHWRRGGSVALRLMWAVLLLVPVIGWLFCFSLYSPTERSAREAQRADAGFMLQPSRSNLPDSTTGRDHSGLDAG